MLPQISNFQKLQLVPTQIFEFLGELYNLLEAKVYPTQKRYANFYNHTSKRQDSGC